MNKNEFVNAIASKTDISKKDVAAVLDAIPEIVIEEVRDNGENIVLFGLGTFKQKVTAAHVGRNPATGEALDIPESRTVAFKAMSSVKKVVTKKKKK